MSATKSFFSESSSIKRPMRADAELDITPMIDVTFLLLIFFMVTSTMQPEASLEVPPARHGKGVDTGAATVITIAAREGESEIYLGDGVTGPPVSLSEVPPYVQQGVDDPEQSKQTVIIKADRELPSGFVEEVARAANQVEGIDEFYVGVQDRQ